MRVWLLEWRTSILVDNSSFWSLVGVWFNGSHWWSYTLFKSTRRIQYRVILYLFELFRHLDPHLVFELLELSLPRRLRDPTPDNFFRRRGKLVLLDMSWSSTTLFLSLRWRLRLLDRLRFRWCIIWRAGWITIIGGRTLFHDGYFLFDLLLIYQDWGTWVTFTGFRWIWLRWLLFKCFHFSD